MSEEAKATAAEAEASGLKAIAKTGREDAEKDETAASKDKAGSIEKEHEAAALKKLAEQKEQEAANAHHAAEVAEKA